MTSPNPPDDDAAVPALSEFAYRLDQICQTEPVIFYASAGRKGLRVNSIELGDGGLNLYLDGHSPRFIGMGEIGKFMFYKTHPFDYYWVTPDWLCDPPP